MHTQSKLIQEILRRPHRFQATDVPCALRDFLTLVQEETPKFTFVRHERLVQRDRQMAQA